MAKSSSTIGIGTIIFWVVIAFMWFSDDDEDKKEVKVETDKPIVETEDGSRAKNELIKSWETVLAQAKEAYSEATSDETKQNMRDAVNKAKKRLKELTGNDVVEEEPVIAKEPPKAKTYLKAPAKEGEIKELEEVEKDDGMQKL